MIILGFTGTRQGLLKGQLRALATVLKSFPKFSLLHGGAKGADTLADSMAFLVGVEFVDVYPCSRERYMFWLAKDDNNPRTVHDINQPLVRNRIIARDCDHLIATPLSDTEQIRSGTWATIRYARAENKPITLITRSGDIIK